MSFEIIDRDLVGRIGTIKTKSGIVHTPTVFPVIDPVKNIISPNDMKKDFKINQLITNIYLIKQAVEKGKLHFNDVHTLLNFDGVIMTDSGAYQMLEYGKISITPEEVIELQEKINSDISVILDVPTLKSYTRLEAEKSVIATINNAMMLGNKKTRDDIIWVGPIQGGKYLELVKKCAIKISEMPFFQMYAIGGLTQYMKSYDFDKLIDIIMTIKLSLPANKPLHIFGAGHPILFSFLVALGCDTFDSASYALFAKDDRYMTPYGTVKFSNLKYLPCSCDVCRKYDVKDLIEINKKDREVLLAKHNLWVITTEINSIKQAIYEGRLWELMEVRSKAHPKLFNLLIKFKKYKKFIEKNDPLTKSVVRGIFCNSSHCLARPEITRHLLRLKENVSFTEKNILILIPENTEYRKYAKYLLDKLLLYNDLFYKIHICIYGFPFGIIPIELLEVYPLSQYEKPDIVDKESEKVILHALKILIEKGNYNKVILIFNSNYMTKSSLKKLIRLLKYKGIKISLIFKKFPQFKIILEKIKQ
ncbi:MAG: tRNA guanosine(15) transglycosylase TgtA [Candidatus Methanomethylicia archaeon]